MFSKISALSLFTLLFFVVSCSKDENPLIETDNATDQKLSAMAITYTMPDETQTHEGTWLQWPHQYQYGATYRNRIESTWVEMTRQLVQSENVHIIAYNSAERTRITNVLTAAGVPLTNVNFKLFQTNDVWVRDNGPIFVRNNSGQLRIEDWGFNGWGNKTPFAKCNVIPASVGNSIGMSVVNLNSAMKIEGGGYEIDGNGVFMACKSSILNSNRNPGMTKAQAEAILTTNLGVTKFIWLDGVAGLEITDMHIDGFARFGNPNTIVTMNNTDLLYWDVPQTDITKLYAATKTDGTPYNFVYLPLTQNNVTTTWGNNLGYKGSYVNFYTANNKVLVPFYNDPNDEVARSILQTLYPTKTVVGIDVRNLYKYGGMIHCVTQQQPAL